MKAETLVSRVQSRIGGWRHDRRIARLTSQVERLSSPSPNAAPIIFFNASTRLTGLSLNAAFSLLTSWSLRLQGLPVIHFVCKAGLSRCVLSAARRGPEAQPPCAGCIDLSRRLYAGAQVRWYAYYEDPDLRAAIQDLSVAELSTFEYPFQSDRANFVRTLSAPEHQPPTPSPQPPTSIPLGALVLPSLRWTLRRHHLQDDKPTRFLFRAYMLSAYNVAQEFSALLAESRPRAVVLFNGMMYPEAAARWAAQRLGVPVITHEVSFQRFSAFFTHGEATAYPLQIPETFELSEAQNALLDSYLEGRFQGKFTMAGIRFWPEMRGLDEAFLQRAAGFKGLVPVFTNVAFDTSQAHSNVVFPHMFAWLDLVLEIIRDHPEYLFVIRAHPDEMRPGSAKQSRESVHDWVKRNRVDQLPNVIFIDPQEYISSYELVGRSHFVMVYNSSIGLEATILGAAVLCGGKARYTQYPIVFFPPSPEEYRQQAEAFLAAEHNEAPPEWIRNARRFLYYQLYRASLPFGEWLQNGARPGFVALKTFDPRTLLPDRSATMLVLRDGIIDGKSFLLAEEGAYERAESGKN